MGSRDDGPAWLAAADDEDATECQAGTARLQLGWHCQEGEAVADCRCLSTASDMDGTTKVGQAQLQAYDTQ